MTANSTRFATTRGPAPVPKLSPVFLTLVVGVLTAVVAHFAGWYRVPAADQVSGLAATLAQIATTMLGFMLAALAIVASINHTHLVQMMKRTGHYQDLLLTLLAGSLAFLACAILSMGVLFGMELDGRLMSILVGTHVAALFALVDVGRKFWLVLTSLQSQR